MNRIYRLVWNRQLRAVQVASELASSGNPSAASSCDARPRRRALSIACLSILALAWAAPGHATNYLGIAGGVGENGGLGVSGTGGIGGNAALGGGNGSIILGYITAGPGIDGTPGTALYMVAGMSGGGGGGAGGMGGSAGGSATPTGGGWLLIGPGGGGGGAGGTVSADGTVGGGGGGGGGGIGATQTIGASGVVVTDSFIGGAGGDGGSTAAFSAGAGAGGGGGGGTGLMLNTGSSSYSVELDGNLVGGAGGNGGNNSAGFGGGGGGAGGAGVVIDGAGSVTLSSSVLGGMGGSGGLSGSGSASLDGSAGDGGVGVAMLGSGTLTVNGQVSGGFSGDGRRQASAIYIQGNSSILSLGPNALLSGAITLGSGSNATLINGQSSSLFNNAIELGSGSILSIQSNGRTFAGTISGGGALVYAGYGTTVTGTNSYSGGTTVSSGGTLNFSSDANLGASSGTLTLTSGGNLVASGEWSTSRTIFVNGTAATNSITTQGDLNLGGAIKQGQALTIDAGMGSITATNVGNDLGGDLTLRGNGINVSSGTDINLAGVTTLGGDVTLNAVGSLVAYAPINLGSASLYLTAQTGTLQLNSSIAAYNVSLSGLSASMQNVTASGNLSLASNGSITQTAGALTVAGTTSLQAQGDISLTSAANSFGGAVTVNAGGNVSLTTADGLTLGNISSSSFYATPFAGNIALTGAISTIGYQAYNAPVTVNGNATVGSTIGAINFQGTIDGSGSLTVTNGGTLSLNGNVGSVTALNSLTVDGAGTTSLGGNVSTTGAQSYAGILNLRQNTTLSGSQISLGSSLDASYGLTVNGKLVTSSGIGTTTALSYLQVNGNATLGGNIITTGAIGVSGATSLSQNLGISSYNSNVSLGSVDGGKNLTVTGADVSLGTVGATTAIGTLTANGTNLLFDGDIHASGLSLYSLNDVTLAHDTTISGAAWLYTSGFGSGTHYLVTGNLASGQTIVAQGATLDIGNGTATGSLSGAATLNGALVFSRTTDSTYAGALSGFTGSLLKSGGATLTLDGDSSGFTGSTTVAGGKLVLGGSVGSTAQLGGSVNVKNGATFGGHGTLTGSLNVQSGAHLAPGNSIGTLTVNGNVTLQQGAVLDFELGHPGATLSSPGLGDKLVVNGMLDAHESTINITDAGGFGAGLYNLIQFNQITIWNGGLTLGYTPAGQTVKLVADLSKGNINLINRTGVALQQWNANGQASSTRMGGGTGTWSLTSPVWANDDGSVTDVMQPAPGYAVFAGTAGKVTVDNTDGQVGATGMQFASDGYLMQGGALALSGSSIIRVGDGTSSSAYMTATIDNVLTGTSGLTKTDFGTLVLNGQNTFSGGVTVSGGTLSVSSDGNLGDASNTVLLNGGSLQITDPALSVLSREVTLGSLGGGLDIASGLTVSLANSLDGSGGLVKDGAGTLSLLNGATYSGGTTIRAGTLLANSDTLHGDVLNDAQLVLQQSANGSYAGSISGSGSLQKTGSGTLTLTGANSYSGGTTVSGGTLVGDTGSLQGDIRVDSALVFAQASDGIFDGVLSGAGALSKSGSGTLVLNGHNSANGTLKVQAGKLVVGDDSHGDAYLAGAVDVASGATLGGSGSIGGLNLAGTVTPGNSIGTLTINGDATFQKGSAYQVEVDPNGSSDRIVVNGHATLLGGSAVAIGPSTGWSPSTTYTILTATGGISGKFDSVSSQLAFLSPLLSYSGNAITLQLIRNDVQLASVATTDNQRNTAVAAESLGAASPLFGQLIGLDAATARATFDQLSGEVFASTRTALINDSRYVRDAINRRLLGADQAEQGARATNADGVSAWTSVWGHWGASDGDGNAARSSANGSGVLLGGDLTVGGDARLGAVVGHGQSSAKVTDRHSDAHATSTWAGVYGDASFGRLSIRGAATYAWHDVDSNRTLTLGDSSNRLGASYHANSWQAYAEGSYAFTVGERQTLSPFLNLAHVALDTDGAREQGGLGALRALGDSSSVSYATLGLRDSWQSAAGVSVHASLGWQMAWGDRASTSRMRFVEGGNAFSVAGVPVAQHAAAVDAGVSFPLSQHARIDASYLGQFASHARDQAARLSLVVSF